MRKLLVFVALVLAVSCQRQTPVEPKQQFPTDKELFDPTRDAIAARGKPPKPPKGGGNPHNPPPTDTIVNPPSTGKTVIYLDFDGEQVGGIWGSFYAPPSGLNIEQQEAIMTIVRESYTGFPIEVTNSLSVFLSYPKNKRMRVIETTVSNFQPNSGGVAYVGSYLWADDTPSFVFPDRYGNNIDWIGHASTHEPGHMIGLRHQSVYDENCNKIAEYRIGWHMGSYGGVPGIFSVGQSTSCCSCIQDDKAIISSNL